MTTLKKLLHYLCVPIALYSVYIMLQTKGIPIWQIIGYSTVIVIPCFLILFWKPFDIFFGLSPPKVKRSDSWASVTPWIGWMMLTAMILLNHFARPPAG